MHDVPIPGFHDDQTSDQQASSRCAQTSKQPTHHTPSAQLHFEWYVREAVDPAVMAGVGMASVREIIGVTFTAAQQATFSKAHAM